MNFTEKLARAFAAQLRTELTAAQLREVNKLNADGTQPNACASHNYVDANMSMCAAWEKVCGVEPDTQSEGELALWNAAWTLAKLNNFWSR